MAIVARRRGAKISPTNHVNLAIHPVDPKIEELFSDLVGSGQNVDDIKGFLKIVNKPLIEEYIKNTIGPTHHFTLNLVEAFSVERPGDDIKYRRDLHNKKLLWHGTRAQNVTKILRQGFDIRCAKKGTMFGPGFYFSDCVTKSANYTGAYATNPSLGSSAQTSSHAHRRNFAYLFLCEVALGNMKPYMNADYRAKSNLKPYENSSHGQGSYSCIEDGCQFEDDVLICPGLLLFDQRKTLEYNEYVVYNTNQVRIRYLVKVELIYRQALVMAYTQIAQNQSMQPRNLPQQMIQMASTNFPQPIPMQMAPVNYPYGQQNIPPYQNQIMPNASVNYQYPSTSNAVINQMQLMSNPVTSQMQPTSNPVTNQMQPNVTSQMQPNFTYPPTSNPVTNQMQPNVTNQMQPIPNRPSIQQLPQSYLSTQQPVSTKIKTLLESQKTDIQTMLQRAQSSNFSPSFINEIQKKLDEIDAELKSMPCVQQPSINASTSTAINLSSSNLPSTSTTGQNSFSSSVTLISRKRPAPDATSFSQTAKRLKPIKLEDNSTTSTTQQSTGNPYNTQQSTGNPYNTQQSTGNPYHTQQSTGNPYHTQQSTGNPYHTQQSTGNPYNTQQSTGNPYNTQQSTGNPYYNNTFNAYIQPMPNTQPMPSMQSMPSQQNSNPAQNQSVKQILANLPSVYCQYFSSFAPPHINPLRLISNSNPQNLPHHLCAYCNIYHP